MISSRPRRKLAVAGGGELSLSRVPWEGGPAYWTVAQNGAMMTKAEAAGWSDPSFFPICIFLMKVDSGHPQAYVDLGVNTAMAAEDESPGVDLTQINSSGIWVLATPDNPNSPPDPGDQTGWDYSDIGEAAQVVGWFLCDEPDMNYAGFIGTNDQFGWLASVQQLSATADARGDGRFKFANFGNGVLNTFWSPLTLADMVAELHGFAVDKYPYTSADVRFIYGQSQDWADACGLTVDTQAARDAALSSAAYGWMVKQMRETFQDPENLKPHWGFVEVKHPKLNEAGSRIILHAEMEGACWNAICNEARGISYFDHFGDAGWPATDPNTGTTTTTESRTLVDGPQTYKDAAEAINAKVTEMAPILNTQSYVFDFGPARVTTMLKAKDGFAYIFACIGPGGSTGSKTFTVTGSGITGTNVEVLHEARSLTISGGQFSDTFANEYSYHIYKVTI
jgi:hypothetical protein